MIKIPDIQYKRYTIEEAKAAFSDAISELSAAKCADDVLKAREKYLETVNHFVTAATLSNIRFTLNTADEFYIKEHEYYDEVSPVAESLMVKYADAMLVCPYRDELVKSGKINPIVFKRYEVAKKAHDDKNIEDEQLENSIVTEYAQLMASLTCNFMGEEMPLSVLRSKMTDGDRAVRRAAADAIGEMLEKVSDKLDDIYDRLVKVRTRIAKRLGLDNFTQLGYYRMSRIDYNRDMIEKFRAGVKEYIVPVVSELKESIGKKLGVDKFMFYDNEVYSDKGDERPKLDKDGIFKAAQDMYDSMDKEIGDYMRFMQQTEAFDVESRKNKWGGGYCTELPDYEQNFILANFNGSSGDIDVITHEFGHAYAMGQVYVCGDKELQIGGYETAECHSMSMEFLCWKYIDRFFNNGDAYRYKHLCDSLTFIPYGVIVDEFQHRVYDNPDLTPAQRDEVWCELEKKYRPYMSTDGIPYLEKGTRWQYQMHIFEEPFYYIDYCLAQTVALGFLSMSLKNYGEALNKYKQFCKTGGTKPFSQLVKDAGIPDPFAEGALKALADDIKGIIKKLDK